MSSEPGVRKAFSIRDEQLVRELDTHIARLQQANVGRRVTREGLARELLYMALRDPAILRELRLLPLES